MFSGEASMLSRRVLLLSPLILLAACGSSGSSSDSSGNPPPLTQSETPAATPKAVCGPGSRPETGLQGRVSPEDHASGRAAQGFTSNLELVGLYPLPNP